jgi:hypothetical protein
VDGYGNLIAARLRKLAAARSTGTLPFTGDNDGAIYFRDGKVVFAESKRTPGLATRPATPPATRPPTPEGSDPAPPGGGPAAGNGVSTSPSGQLSALLAVAEPTVDAALELLSSESRYVKFRPARALPFSPAFSLPLEWLLAEVVRRQQLLKQLSAVLTPDTTVVRNPQMSAPGVQVSTRQWALLIRVKDGTTPRDLAWELSRSVFGTTAEVFRLLVLRLLSVTGYPTPGTSPGASPLTAASPALLSFIRAVPGAGDGD